MPGFDGRGPVARGPLTGGGRGYCALVLPDGQGVPPYGYAGAQGAPVAGAPYVAPGAVWGWPRRGGRGHGRGRWGRWG